MRKPGKNAPLHHLAAHFVVHWLGPRAFTPFTGQDSRAFDAWVYLLSAYSVTDHRGSSSPIATAMGAILRVPQPHVLPVFKQAIAHALDWSDIDSVWALANGPVGITVSYGMRPVHKDVLS